MVVPARAAQPARADSLHPSRDGVLVLEQVRDQQEGARWLDGPDGGILSWRHGAAVLPAGAVPGTLGVAALTVPFTRSLGGISGGRRVVFQEGNYVLSAPVLLYEGGLQVFLTGGNLQIEPGRLVHRPSGGSSPPPRAQYLLLAGIVLVTAILLIRARSRLRR
jgi:hypothetical protein